MENGWAQYGLQRLGERDDGRIRLRGITLFRSDAIRIAVIAIAGLVLAAFYPSPGAVLLLGLVEMSYINYLISGRDVLYPAFMYTTIWAIVAAAYDFCPIPIDRIGWKTAAIFLAGGVSFSVGSLLGNRPLAGQKHSESRKVRGPAKRDNPQARNILLGCAVVVTLLFLINIIYIAGGIFAITPMLLLKLNSPDSPLADAGPIASFVIGSGGLIPVLALWIMLLENEARWKVLVCAFCVALFPLFVTQRGLVMVAFCGCITLFLLKRKDRSFARTVRPLGFAAGAIVLVMALLSITKPWVQREGGYTVAEGAWIYIAGPFATFNYAVYHPEFFRDEPEAVFSQVLTPLGHLGLIRYQTQLEVDGSRFDRFVNVPFPGNVYTAYKPYYEDFGALGCFIAFALFGFVEGRLFWAAVRGKAVAMFFLTYLAGPLMFSTFDDFYHGFSRHLNMVIFAIGYFWILKRVRIRLLG